MGNAFPEPVSIFNDVIGPVMTGPSSSHTAGPARIGRAVHGLAGGVSRAVIHFKKDGAYPGTYRGQGTDKGFIGGLLGFGPEHELLGASLQEAGRRGLEFAFEIEDNPHPHPNTARIVVTDARGSEREFLTESTGGGMFRIFAMDGFPVSVTGEYWELFIQSPRSEVLEGVAETALALGCRVERRDGSSGSLLQITGQAPFAPDLLHVAETLRKDEGCRISRLDPLLPVPGRFCYDMPFFTAGEALKSCKGAAVSAAELAFAYETARSGDSHAAILSRMTDVVRVMRQAAAMGMEKELPVTGFLKPKAAQMARAVSEVRLADLGIMNRGMVIATAIMEYNSSGGIVVAAPTAGSCGILPAVVLSLAESLALSPDTLAEAEAEAMLVAGLVGVFIAHQATFAAEVCACQAEVGAASAMAAAAAVQLLGGTAEQAFAAAGLALQNLLGLICDPVAGLVEIPCVNRNTMGAANAVASANMVMAGFDPVIPLDEVIGTMLRVGKMLPGEFRCTNLGGLCTTPTAIGIRESLDLR